MGWKSHGPMKRALPDDWKPSPDLVAWAARECPRLDTDYHTLEFVDYWLGCGKPMASWDATWRNWMRRAYSGRFGQPRLRPVEVRAQAAGVHDLGLIRSARAHGIDPAGMSESEINNAIWQKQQTRK